jgi:putative restriction endonuclease
MVGQLTAFVAVTDRDWYETLCGQPDLDELNFWQPSGATAFKALQPGEPLLFKLHSPDDYIVGGGFFAYWTRLSVALAWEAFGTKNGARSIVEMRRRIERYRRVKNSPEENYEIGCILLEQPFFLERDQWILVPDWHSNIVRGKRYDLTTEPGESLWKRIAEAIAIQNPQIASASKEIPIDRFGKPILVRPRLGQGSFRVLVTDAYGRRCAVTGERVLPVLEAAHIRPYATGGEHRVDNGLLLRSDLHALFDRGYMTVTPELRIEVSRRLQSEFENGKQYLALNGNKIATPSNVDDRPSTKFLEWHNENLFRS